MRRRAAVALGLLALAGAPAAAGACGEAIVDGQRLSGARDVVVFAPGPARWTLGRHFAIDLQVCPREGVSLPDEVRVDARMPEHGHGMGYRPRVTALAGGRWRVEGLMLHMAGRWELSFELRRGEQVERLVQELRLR